MLFEGGQNCYLDAIVQVELATCGRARPHVGPRVQESWIFLARSAADSRARARTAVPAAFLL